MVLPSARPRRARVFEKWELDFAAIGRVTDTGAPGAAHATARGRRRHAGRAAGHGGAGLSTGPMSRTPVPRAGDRPRRRCAARRSVRRAAQAARLSRPRLQALDLGAVRPPGHGRHGAAAGRRRGGGADPRRQPQGAGAHHRLHAALLRGRSRDAAASRRWRRAGATSPRSARCRSPSPTTSISAIPRSPRSWASSSAASRAWREACRALDYPGRVRQRLALQRDQRQGHPADAGDRRRRADRRCRRRSRRSR